MGAPTIETSPSDELPERVLSDLVEAERAARYAWAAGLARGARVLDLGCGDAAGSLTLARAGAAEVIGVEAAQQKLDTVDVADVGGVSLVAADAAALPFDDDRFDLVLALGGVDVAALAELQRVLAPDGTLVVARPERPNPDPHAPAPPDLEAALAERFAHRAAARQASRIMTEVAADAGDATHTLLLASGAALTPPEGVAVDAGTAGWAGWQRTVDDLRAENAELRRALELAERGTAELAELRAALLDAEQLLAEREDLRADLRDAESDLRELIEHLRSQDIELGRFEETTE